MGSSPVSASSESAGEDVRRGCASCGTRIPDNDPILLKFSRCYYCGEHNPLGNKWLARTAPGVIVAAIGLIAIWWTQLPS